MVVFENLGVPQSEFDRSELRKLVVQTGQAQAEIQGDKRPWAYVYSPDANYLKGYP